MKEARLYPFPQRTVALDAAVRLFERQPTPPAPELVTGYANAFLAYLTAKRAARFTVTATVTGPHGHKSAATISNGGTMSTQMTMDDTVTLAASPTDDHGDPTSDVLVFAPDDGGAVLTLAVDGNTATGTPVGEGTVSITITDPASPGLAPDVVTIDVGAGPTAAIQVSATVNTGANPAPTA